MAFFDRVGETLSSFGNDFSSKTKSMMDVSGYTSQLKTCQKTLNDNYLEIGKIYYVRNMDNPDPQVQALFARVKEAQEAIAHLNDAIRQSKGVKICSNCGAEVALDGLFCQACGNKMENFSGDDMEDDLLSKCPSCGADVRGGSAFCEECGTKL